MENSKGVSPFRWLIRAWLALSARKIRLLQAGDILAQGPELFVVNHPAGLRETLVLASALERPVRFLLPERLACGRLARFLALRLDAIFFEADKPISEQVLSKAVDVLAAGEALLIFADSVAASQDATKVLAASAASIVWRAEGLRLGRSVTVRPVHLFLPEAGTPSREILIYVDSAIDRPPVEHPTTQLESDKQADIAALESRLRDNAFMLSPVDVDYFLADIEETLRRGLQDEWDSLPDWKQDTEGFLLSRQVVEWVRQTNYLDPSLLVSLRNSLGEYRSLQRRCALLQLEVERADSLMLSGWGRLMLWAETALGLPIALFGLINHLGVGLVLFMAGSFRKENPRLRTTEWIIRASVTVVFYVLQIFLVGHWWGRAAAGYYAPALPVSGVYLWRYARLARPQAHFLLASTALSPMKRKIKRRRQALGNDLDRVLATFEEKASVTR
jgi:1-acyl-sn-glycerol-3-phosphate acyltransferase